MKHYKADISVKRVGVITAPRIPADHPNVRHSSCRFTKSISQPSYSLRKNEKHSAHSSCLHREVFPAADITEARQRAIARVKYPNTPEFLNCLNFYYVPFKTLQWKDWQGPREPEGETQIDSCESQPFLNGVFKWIVKILVYEVDANGNQRSPKETDYR